jgi:hypothetical protein
MKTLIDVDRYLWGKIKDYATVNSLSLNSALEDLLRVALNKKGYILSEKEENKPIV